MTFDLAFDEAHWEQINDYLSEWDRWRKEESKGRPDFTDSAIFLVPVTIALLRSEKRLERLTWALVVLTIVLAALTTGDILVSTGVI